MILTNELAVEMETKVSFIVNKYASSYNREDLMQAGKMGVIKAADANPEGISVTIYGNTFL